jgi:hypothetical protein
VAAEFLRDADELTAESGGGGEASEWLSRQRSRDVVSRHLLRMMTLSRTETAAKAWLDMYRESLNHPEDPMPLRGDAPAQPGAK